MQVLDRHKGPSVYQSQHGTVLSYLHAFYARILMTADVFGLQGQERQDTNPIYLRKRIDESRPCFAAYDSFPAYAFSFMNPNRRRTRYDQAICLCDHRYFEIVYYLDPLFTRDQSAKEL